MFYVVDILSFSEKQNNNPFKICLFEKEKKTINDNRHA